MNTSHEMYEIADRFVANTNRNIFLTGKAGTGKTTFLQQLREKTGKQMAIVAPTGVAAINAGGTTIHSFFQLPLSPFVPTPEGRKELISKLKMQRHQRRVIRELELLVIDEVSMVRADVMDAIDTILKNIRYRQNEPFGGVQVIFIGDMYQLSPVAKEEEWRFLSRFYDGIYFFFSKIISEQNLLHIEFEKIFRQSDMNFISLLNKIRNNELDSNALETLQKCYKPNFKPQKNDTYITLTTHNYKADKINQEELSKIKNPSKIFKAEIKGDFPEKNYPIDANLELKIGAKVMFLKNDTENPRRFYNGKIGEIIEFEDDEIIVKCENDEKIAVSKMEWHNIKYKTDEETQQINEDILGVFKQFPLRLAWAITIHKSQGLTFDKAIIDAEDAFAAGQVYVALSRCRSLEGIVLTSLIQQHSIHNDNKIVQFSSLKNSFSELNTQYETSENDFFTQLLLSIFDFKNIVSNAKNLLETINSNDIIFQKENIEFAGNIIKQSIELQDIAVNFQQQLVKICVEKPINHSFLQQRIQAAEQFFSEKFNHLINLLKASPVTTDNKQVARDYDEDLKEIYTLTEQKKQLISGIKNEYSIQKYYSVKKSFVLPEWNVTSNSRKSQRSYYHSKNPALMSRLISLRNDIADEYNLPIFIVAGSITISEMADYLPLNKKDLLKISGFGDNKYDRFGEIFLDCIRDYCVENQLETNMQNLPKREKRAKKEKKPKVNTAEISFEMFQNGLTISDIAKNRSLTEGTIAGHLVKYVVNETLNINQFISLEKIEEMKQLIKENNLEISVYQLLKDKFTDIEIRFGMAYIKKQKSS